jgi:hypothetical protein
MKNEVLIYWDGKATNLADRALDVVNFLCKIDANFSFGTYKNDNTLINLQNIQEAVDYLIGFKIKEIKKYDKMEVNGDYIDYLPHSYFIVSNEVLFRFNLGGPKGNSLVIEGEALKLIDLPKLLQMSIEFFNPKWGVITSTNFRDTIADQTIKEYWFGWMTYFSDEIKLPNLPADFSVKKLDKGKLIITTEETFSDGNKSHVDKAMRLVNLFRKERVLSS